MTTMWQNRIHPDPFAGHNTEERVWDGFNGSEGPLSDLSVTGLGITLRAVRRCLRDDCVQPGQPNVFLRLSEPEGGWLTAVEARQLGEALLDAAAR